jgi:hypothetical protein
MRKTLLASALFAFALPALAVNSVTLSGKLVAEPLPGVVSDGTFRCTLSLLEPAETLPHKISCGNDLAKACCSLAVGDQLLVTGKVSPGGVIKASEIGLTAVLSSRAGR